MILRLTLIVVMLCCALSTSIAAPVKNLTLEHLSVADGLNQGTVHSIIQDSNGFIWIGTENGINVYDGYTVRNLKGPDGDFDKYPVYEIREGRKGRVWLSVYGKGLYFYDINNNTFTRVAGEGAALDSNYVIGSLETENGNSDWIATEKKLGIYHHNTQSHELVLDLSEQLSGYNFIYRMRQFDDFLFLATRAGLFVYHTKSKQVEEISLDALSKQNPDSFKQEEARKTYDIVRYDDRIIFGTNDGLYEFSFEAMKASFTQNSVPVKIDQLANNISIWMFYQEQEYLYTASTQGLYKLHLPTNKNVLMMQFSDAFQHIASNDIRAITKDKNGVFWLGSPATGAYYWNPHSELIWNIGYDSTDTNLDNLTSLSAGGVYALQADQNESNIVWVGSQNGLNRVDLVTGKVERFLVSDQSKTTYTEGNILDIHQIEDTLWLTTHGGVIQFDTRTKAVKQNNFKPETLQWLQQEYVLLEHLNGELWLFGEKGAAKLNVESGELQVFDEIAETLGINTIWNTFSDFPYQEGKIVASTNDALWTIDPKSGQLEKLHQFEKRADAEAFYIDSVKLDKNNVLWVAYAGLGLFGLDPLTFEQLYFYDNSNSIINENVYSLATDRTGNIWFSTHAGIFSMNPDSQHIRNFTSSDGLASDEFNGNAFAALSDGKFIYGTMLGATMFDPVLLAERTTVDNFSLRFANVDALNRDLMTPMFIGNNHIVHLNYDDVGVRVDFSTFSFLDSERILFKYSLSGPVNINSPLTKQNYITFPKLSSGNYTLKVWAKSPYSGEFSEPGTIQFRVTYAPWRSPVALFFYSAVLLTAFVFWMRNRYQQQQALIDAHRQVKVREERLQLALRGSNSEVWDWVASENRIYGKRFKEELNYQDKDKSVTLEEHIGLIHPEDREHFIAKWQMFLMQADKNHSFECTYRLQHRNGEWLWFKDLGKIVAIDLDGIAIRVTGSYTNVTQAKAEEERAQHFGDAFKQTQDWVFILDEKLTRVTANQSLCKVFGWEHEEFDFDPNLLGIRASRRSFYSDLLPRLKAENHYSGEEIVITPSGEEYHVMMNISASFNQASHSYHYIFVMTDISAQKTAENELRLLANYDHLTGLPNRSLLLERIKHAIEKANRYQSAISVFFIDLDRFKQINDSLGHDYGDLLLKEITKRLTDTLREDDTVARIGGDEFVVLLENFKSNRDLGRIAQKIIDVVEQPVKLNNYVVSVGASIGIALYPDDSNSQEQLLRNADVAMYHAKQMGRNNFQFFTEHMNEDAKQRLAKESNMKLAVTNDEFSNVYQPLVDAHTGKAVGAELLMRWISADGFVSPAEFIPLAEELGLIAQMTDVAMNKGFAELKRWRQHRPDFYLSVNLSAPHFIDEGLVDFIDTKLKAYDLPASALKLEVTESALISEPEKAIKSMQALNALGVKLALDDFGTGFSSLTYLKQLPLDILKIDKSFVDGIGVESTDEAIVDATLVLANSLNMACIAEGVETQEQLQYLVDRECHFIQGYLYYPPLKAEDLADKLIEDKVEIKATAKVS
ncbi:EAL domain-containing protein [Thalassotalea euphylliae]|uniref:EAL domain-containing protein n=1 Tax=Thalassotalea euphylliae TaxID=1655234 RepID=UPI00362B11C2